MVEPATATWLIAALLRLGDCLEPRAWELGFYPCAIIAAPEPLGNLALSSSFQSIERLVRLKLVGVVAGKLCEIG